MKLSEELQWRGFYNQTTFDSPTNLDEQQYTLYLGTDPSADSLHVGHLAVYMMVRRFLDHGHKVVLLVGGGTGIVGDPGGRDDERQILSLEKIAENKAALGQQVAGLFSGKDFELVDNYDWLKDVSILEFLRDVGKHFGMSQLVQRDYIAKRIGEGGSGISYAEFSYTLLQGYDYWHLHNNHGVNLQIGGSDQWGNILSGVELIRKKEGDIVHAMTAPLVINKATGKKFGKSEGGAVWLDPSKTSIYKFYQFWLNADDEGAVEYLKLFTLLGKDDIDTITENHAANPGARIAQKTLARELTDLVHGKERRESVERVTEVLFGSRQFSDLSQADLDALAEEIPVVNTGKTIVESLVEAQLASSNGEARRLIVGGAISVNGQKVVDDRQLVEVSLLKKGKNSFALVRTS
ncbi:MAG TPA: tyrosine--tRNA ligase [Candidatus Saccharimonadales bacterium]|nr:tyrosine--tRNA ligase [Candidatus Saccharimonadales bacterium]